MKRIGCLVLAAVPVVVMAVLYVTASDGSGSGPAGGTSVSQQDLKDTKARASGTTKRSEDEQVIADAPPGLAAPAMKELAQKIVSSAENSTLNWRSAYDSVEDIGDGCGYTAGVVGFCSGTHDLLSLVENYTKAHPGNGLERFLPALRKVDGTDSHEGLDPGFPEAWRAEARLPEFRAAQDAERDRVYFDPSVRLAKLDGLGALGQLIYYDAMVLHGPGTDRDGFYVLRDRTRAKAKPPAEGGDETAYLNAFLDVRREAMKLRPTMRDTSRIDTMLRRFLKDGNLQLRTPLRWTVYGESYRLP
ncbi:chitosanase [Streptomyces thermocoprophilus]|uniref:Chitosanase n=1 Tax=Streptomyces thermocoprophilus TaxID=78356 RepID=A0ABV5VFT4_9ACTN